MQVLLNHIRMATSFLIMMVILLACFSFPAYAQGGMAMAGTFAGWQFNVPPGTQVSGEDIFVIVFNNSEHELTVEMSYSGPKGVEVAFSKPQFRLAAGENCRVFITVKVATEAIPGEYNLIVTSTAAPVTEVGTIGVGTALGQKANLVITGESASVTVRAVGPEGKPAVAVVKLYKVAGGQSYEVASSDTGILEARVSPGSFTTAAYVGGEKVGEKSFTVAAGEEKTVTLSAATIYFEGFGIVPNYHQDTGELIFTQIVYTVKNLYQPVDEAEVILEVKRDGTLLEEISLATLSPLDMGSAGLNYNYIPSDGWLDGSYSFRLRLKLDGKLYVATIEKLLNVSVLGVAGKGKSDRAVPQGRISTAVIGGITAAIIVAGGTCLLVRRRRRI